MTKTGITFHMLLLLAAEPSELVVCLDCDVLSCVAVAMRVRALRSIVYINALLDNFGKQQQRQVQSPIVAIAVCHSHTYV